MNGVISLEITSQYAQIIVDMTMKTFHYNINIMDHMGVIVGSGDRKRIGLFHQGAAEVIRTGKPLEISIDEAQKLKGAKPGINLPIYFNDKIVGVVGITEDPDKVKPFGELLKMSVEAMLQQVFLAEQLRMEQHARELYIQDILNGNSNLNEEDIGVAKGELLGFNMTVARVAMVIKILNNKTFGKTGQEPVTGGDSLKFDLRLQKRNENILNEIKMVFNNPQHIISYNGSNYFIVFYANQGISNLKLKTALVEYLRSLDAKLGKYNISCLIGVGLCHAGIDGLRKSYNEAIQAIDIGEKTRKFDNEIDKIILAGDVALEMVLVNQTGQKLQSFIDLILAKNNGQNVFLSRLKLISTLKVFFDLNMNQSIAAKELGISRNTLISRFDMIRNLTGYDPRHFYDAVTLKLLILINELTGLK
jgi:carbohydrate diacid regulator